MSRDKRVSRSKEDADCNVSEREGIVLACICTKVMRRTAKTVETTRGSITWQSASVPSATRVATRLTVTMDVVRSFSIGYALAFHRTRQDAEHGISRTAWQYYGRTCTGTIPGSATRGCKSISIVPIDERGDIDCRRTCGSQGGVPECSERKWCVMQVYYSFTAPKLTVLVVASSIRMTFPNGFFRRTASARVARRYQKQCESQPFDGRARTTRSAGARKHLCFYRRHLAGRPVNRPSCEVGDRHCVSGHIPTLLPYRVCW